ncbi:MAG: hypothetical protein M3P83_05295 [Actinomycetota bacterium]|nr:hypothetical protein [Actinomycetota bacterium]
MTEPAPGRPRTEPASADPAAFYGRRGSRAADWWTVLHPPYTAWHLSYVVIGAALAPELDGWMLLLSVAAFFLALGIAAHALDELHGRPLGTAIPDRTLWLAAGASLLGAVALGVVGTVYAAPWLGPAIPVGVVLVLGYNLELFGGRLHTDLGFALAWGGFPVAAGLLAQHPPPTPDVVASGILACVAAVLLSTAQRRLSTPARGLRRSTAEVRGSVRLRTGEVRPLDAGSLLAPLEGALRALSCAVPTFALALLCTHLPG